MQPISDKDFDKLFHERLADVEVEPSAHVWHEIEKQLHKKKKMPFPVLWLAAACLAAVIAAGLLLAPGREPIKLTGVSDSKPIEKVSAIKPSNPNDVSVKNLSAMPIIDVKKPIEQKPVYVSAKSPVTLKKEVSITSTVERLSQPVERVRNSRIEQVAKKNETVKPVVESPVIASALVEEPTQDVQDEVVMENKNSKSVVSSLVNYVVGKVDKRKDKIIELEHNDEGTKVKSMNLILLKFKSKD